MAPILVQLEAPILAQAKSRVCDGGTFWAGAAPIPLPVQTTFIRLVQVEGGPVEKPQTLLNREGLRIGGLHPVQLKGPHTKS